MNSESVVFTLMGFSRGAPNCMSLISKKKTNAESGIRRVSKSDSNSFIINNLAERVGFDSCVESKATYH
jgi:hypothetical protein